jgi:hypothetical protein
MNMRFSIRYAFLACLLALLLGAAGSAVAGGRDAYRGGYYGGYAPTYPVRDYRQPYYRTPRTAYRRGHDHGAAFFFGGLLLGTLLNSEPRVTTTRVIREPVVIRESRVINAPLPHRRLLRDLHGNCFEIVQRSDGSELRYEQPASACDW